VLWTAKQVLVYVRDIDIDIDNVIWRRLTLSEWSNEGGWDGRGMWHAGGRRDMHAGYWWVIRTKIDRLQVYERIILK